MPLMLEYTTGQLAQVIASSLTSDLVKVYAINFDQCLSLNIVWLSPNMANGDGTNIDQDMAQS
jgi:hypothetical protein